MSISLNNHRRAERGSVLVVVVAMLALVGAIMLLGVGAFHTQDDPDAVHHTQTRQDFLIRELAAYVHLHNQLPCPANPADPTPANFGTASCGTNPVDGIVPYRTLHLSDYDARDGWGRYMTYRISPTLANTTSAAPGNDTIFMRCRRFPWFDGNPPVGPKNVYPQKARFCCPPYNAGFANTTDLKVLNATGGTPVEGIAGRLDTGALYDTVDTPWSDAGDPLTNQGALGPIPAGSGNEEMFAVAIISHGKNGAGAYVAGKAAHQALPLSADELTNATVPGAANTNIVVDRPIDTTPGATYFDDIVIWRTQISLMATLNNSSCYIPWR